MWTWIKRVFFGHTPPPAAPADNLPMLAGSIDELAVLDAEGVALGQQIDAIRERRRVVRLAADQLRAKREAELRAKRSN